MTIRLLEPFRSVHYVGFYVPHALDAYRNAGVDVALAAPRDLADLYPALLRGEADVVWGGPLRLLRDHAADPACPLVAIAEVVARDPFMLIGREAAPEFRLADLARLRVARFAPVPTPWLCLQDDLRRAGIAPDAVRLAPDRPVADALAAYRAADVDIVQVFEPYATELVESGAGHICYAAATRGPTAYTTLITTRRVARERADELQRLVHGLQDGLSWLARSTAGDAAALVAPFFPQLAPATLAAAIARYQALGLWTADARISLDGFVRLKSAAISGGYIAVDVVFDACVDQSFTATPPPA